MGTKVVLIKKTLKLVKNKKPKVYNLKKRKTKVYNLTKTNES